MREKGAHRRLQVSQGVQNFTHEEAPEELPPIGGPEGQNGRVAVFPVEYS